MNRPTIVGTSPRRAPRFAALVAVGALLVAACGNTPSPSPSAAPIVAPSSSVAPSSAAPSASAAETACTGADLSAIGAPLGGAAGSRGSDVVVENHGALGCLLPAGPTIAMVDQGGTVLLTTPPRAGSGPSVAPGGRVGFSLLFGNWCNQSVSLPLHFRLALAGDAIDIGSLAISAADELPPCNGPGQPANLSTSDWQP